MYLWMVRERDVKREGERQRERERMTERGKERYRDREITQSLEAPKFLFYTYIQVYSKKNILISLNNVFCFSSIKHTLKFYYIKI